MQLRTQTWLQLLRPRGRRAPPPAAVMTTEIVVRLKDTTSIEASPHGSSAKTASGSWDSFAPATGGVTHCRRRQRQWSQEIWVTHRRRRRQSHTPPGVGENDVKQPAKYARSSTVPKVLDSFCSPACRSLHDYVKVLTERVAALEHEVEYLQHGLA